MNRPSALERSPLTADEWRAFARGEDIADEVRSAAEGMMAMSGDDEIILLLADALDEVSWNYRRELELRDEIQDKANTKYFSTVRKLCALRDFSIAAMALRDKMSFVYESEPYKAQWQIAKVHGFDYPEADEFNWIAEQERFDSLRASAQEAMKPND